MSISAKDITDAEFTVLETLWDQPGATIRQLADRLYGDGASNSNFATVQKLLERMQAKGFVATEPDVSPKQFSAMVSRDELIGRRLRAVADKLCGGSLTPLLTNLVQAQSLSDSERAELRDLIKRLDKSRDRKR